MPRPTRSDWKTETGLLFAVLVWGINFPIVKSALAVMHPHVMNAFRFAISAGVLGTVYAIQQRQNRVTLSETFRTHGKQIVALGLLGYILYQLSFIMGINNTFAGNAALIMASSPLWTASIGHFSGSERLNGGSWMGLAICLAGTVVIVFGGSQEIDFASASFYGNLLMLLAAAMWGAYTAFSKPVLRDLPASSLAFLGLIVALPLLFSLAVPYWEEVAWSEVDMWVWLSIIFSGSLSTGITIIIWNSAVKTVGAAQTAAYNNLVPFVAVLSSFVLLDEKIAAGQVLGGVLIIAGLVFMRRSRAMPPA